MCVEKFATSESSLDQQDDISKASVTNYSTEYYLLKRIIWFSVPLQPHLAWASCSLFLFKQEKSWLFVTINKAVLELTWKSFIKTNLKTWGRNESVLVKSKSPVTISYISVLFKKFLLCQIKILLINLKAMSIFIQ